MELVYYIGDSPTTTATFTPNPDEELPLGVDGYFLVRKPDGVQVKFDFADPAVTQVSAFVYRLKLPVLDQEGNWAVIAIGVVGVATSKEKVFNVRDSVFVDPLSA